MSCDFMALATPGVQGLHPYEAGKPVEELERELGIGNIIKLASNENPLGPSAKALAAAREALADGARHLESRFSISVFVGNSNLISPLRALEYCALRMSTAIVDFHQLQ